LNAAFRQPKGIFAGATAEFEHMTSGRELGGEMFLDDFA
jgi:hypothetical protein